MPSRTSLSRRMNPCGWPTPSATSPFLGLRVVEVWLRSAIGSWLAPAICATSVVIAADWANMAWARAIAEEPSPAAACGTLASARNHSVLSSFRRLPAFHGVPKHLSYWGHQKCLRTGGLSTHAPEYRLLVWKCGDHRQTPSIFSYVSMASSPSGVGAFSLFCGWCFLNFVAFLHFLDYFYDV